LIGSYKRTKRNIGLTVKKKTATGLQVRTYVAYGVPMGHINLWFTGLILSIYDTNKHYQFTVSSSIKNSSSFVILGAITKPTQITYEEYKQLKKRKNHRL
jgi:hypothetical protein